MDQDTLALIAKIKDEYSGPLREMTKALHGFDDLLKGHQTRSSKSSKEQNELQKKLNERMVESGRTLREIVTPSMAALGVSVGGAGAALEIFIGKLKEAGENFYKIQGAMQASGLSNSGLQSWTRWMGEFGVTADRALSATVTMGDALARLGRSNSDEVQRLESVFNNLHGLISAMESAQDQASRMKLFMDYYLSHPAPPDQRRKLLEAFGLPLEIATASYADLREKMLEQQQFSKDHPPVDLEIAKDLRDAFHGVRDEIEGFQLDLVNAYGGAGAEAIENFGKALHQELEDIRAIIAALAKVNEWLSSIGGKGDFLGQAATGILHPPVEKWLEMLKEKPEPFSFTTPPADHSDKKKQFEEFSKKQQGLFHKSAFIEGGGGPSSDAEELLSRGVKSGMLAAFREWFASISSAGAGGEGGLQNASFGGSTGAAGAGKTPRFGGGGYSMLDDSAGAGPSAPGRGEASGSGSPAPGGVASGGGINREKWAQQLRSNPALLDRFFRHSLGENDHPLANQAVMEEAANRADIRGNKRFDEHGNLSYFQGYYRGRISPKQRAMLEENFSKVFDQGSDVSHGAIDNSSSWLAAKHERNGRFKTVFKSGGETFEVPGWGESGTGERARYPAFRERQLAEAAQRSGAMTHNVAGNADLNVKFENAPAGAQAYLKYGGLFKSGTVDWGHAMPSSKPGE